MKTNAAPEVAVRTCGIRAQRDCVGAANFRVWELRICIVLRGRRGEGTSSWPPAFAKRKRCPPRGPPWPSNLLFLILFSGSDLSAAHISRNFQRLRLSNRQLKHCNSRRRELPRSKFANYTARWLSAEVDVHLREWKSALICYACYRFSATKSATVTPRVANAGRRSCGAALKCVLVFASVIARMGCGAERVTFQHSILFSRQLT